MLLNKRAVLSTAIDSIHNYYEHLVIEQLHEILDNSQNDPEYIADVACVALNQLSPRYIRHDVDMAFYLTSDERKNISIQVKKAVEDAITFVKHSNKQYNEN